MSKRPSISLRRLLGSCLLLLSVAGSAAALDWRGQLTQGGMIVGRTEPGAEVRLDGEPVKVTPDGAFVLGFERDAPATARLEVIYPNGERRVEDWHIAPREYDIQRIEGVPQNTVTPPAEALPRIRREAAAIRAARATDSERLDFLADFRWPLTGRISGVYGSQRFYNGEPRRPHYGIDIAAPRGTKVMAPAAGKVTLTQDDNYFSGGTLIVDHGYGVSSTFIHLHKILVEEGEEVAAGQPIAEVGSTGRSTGPHLDWRINWYDVRLDPSLVVPPMARQQPTAPTATGDE